MFNIKNLFSNQGLLCEKDGLIINRVGMFSLPPMISKEMLALYVNLTSRIGVEIAGMSTPITKEGRENALYIAIDEKIPTGEFVLREELCGFCLAASCMEDLSTAVKQLVTVYPFEEIPKEEGETTGFSGSYNRAKKHFKQNTDVRILLPEKEEFTALEAEAVLAVALREAAENYETVYPYAAPTADTECRNIYFDFSGNAEVYKTDSGICFAGQGQTLVNMAYSFSAKERNPFDGAVLRDISEILSCKNEIGQSLEVMRLCEDRPELAAQEKILVTKEYSRGLVDKVALENAVSKNAGTTVLKNFNDGVEVKRRSYEWQWEGEVFFDIFMKKIRPLVKEGSTVKISGRLSEESDVRRELVKRISAEIPFASSEIEILPVHKSGYSWIEERVIPKLLENEKAAEIKSVKISFPYLMNARGDDEFEDESTPNYGVHMDDPEKFFDIPTRWLQELFPVDELIEEKLGINRDDVEFIRDDALVHTYVLEALNSLGELVFTDSFDVKYIEKNYIKKYPAIGVTHVTTGWIEAVVDGVMVADERILTDLENVWMTLEDEIIPELECYFTDKYGIDGLVAAQPLFNRLQINMEMSEVDRDLGFREERISTAEAMQEDMYFYILDWFKTFGERQCERELDNVGLIIPDPVIVKGQSTKIEVILYQDFADGAELRAGDERILLCDSAAELSLKKAEFDGSDMTLYVETKEGKAFDRGVFLGELLKEGIVDFFSDCNITFRLSCQDRKLEFIVPKRVPCGSVFSEKEKDRLLDNEVFDYQQYLELLYYYEGRENIRLLPAETTFKGRKIFAIECIKRSKGVFYAGNKLKSERISTIFTARHHGNESSSLNSTFRLLERLLGDMSYTLTKTNVVLVPFVNIDGGSLHCEIQRKNPKWLGHPARYNSAGFEFRKDFDNPNSKYGEAKLLGKLWNHYLFDVITDNHGFEGHELCQPFSGYISPWYKSFWIPRALYYGYIWFCGGNAAMAEMGTKLRQKVADRINGDAEIHRLNVEFADRFHKYAEKWFPELFKLDRYQDVVFYWIDMDERPRAANYGMRHPEITVIDWTTELADETAVGEYMETNARGHHISDLAVFELLEECDLKWDSAILKKDGVHIYSKFRRHPLFAKAD